MVLDQVPPAGNGGGVVNMTRAMEALSPLLNEPRKTIIKVEALVAAVTTLLFLQLVFGFCKRLWYSSVVNSVLFLSNAFMFLLILYTLGFMLSSPIKNSVYPVLAVSLLMAAGGTNAIKQYDFNDNKKLVESFFEISRFVFYVAMLVTLSAPTTLMGNWGLEHQDHKGQRNNSSSFSLFGLYCVCYVTAILESVNGYILSKSVQNGKCVANWMKKISNDEIPSNPQSLVGYRYLVWYPVPETDLPIFVRILTNLASSSIYRKVTVDEIWASCSDPNVGRAFKDVCLSFALFELLKRRYYGFVCAEARLSETKDFVFKGLLPTEDDYERAFRIIEMELGFCYDFLFTKHHSIYTAGMVPVLGLLRFVCFIAKISLICVIGVYTIKTSLFLESPVPIIEVHSIRADYIMAGVVLFTVLLVEVLQAGFYLVSDWFTVWLASWYATPLRNWGIGFLRICFVSVRLTNKIGQFSVISDFGDYRKKRSLLGHMVFLLKKKPDPEVSVAMKKYIARSLISTQEPLKEGNPTNGKTSLEGNGVLYQYRWSLERHHQVEFMLIWHIATDYCDVVMGTHVDGVNLNNQDDRDIAVKLSRYYAYLIAYVPELLPYHAVDIKRLRDTLMEEVKIRLASTTSYETVSGLDIEENPTTIFEKGVKLGRQLKNMGDRNHQCWKVLADFWAETIIYIAPSHLTAKHHMEHLENGGEFLTYIWAMLSHAGILNLDRDKDQGTEIVIRLNRSANSV